MGCWLSRQGPLPGQRDQLSRVPKDLGRLDSSCSGPLPKIQCARDFPWPQLCYGAAEVVLSCFPAEDSELA